MNEETPYRHTSAPEPFSNWSHAFLETVAPLMNHLSALDTAENTLRDDCITENFTGANHVELARIFRVSLCHVYHVLRQERQKKAKQAIQTTLGNDLEVLWAGKTTQLAAPYDLSAVLQALKKAEEQGYQDRLQVALYIQHEALPKEPLSEDSPIPPESTKIQPNTQGHKHIESDPSDNS